MPFVGSIIPSRLVTPPPLKPVRKTKDGERAPAREGGGDEAELSVTRAEAVPESREVARATSEDADEERPVTTRYAADGGGTDEPEAPRSIDVAG